MTEIDPTNHYLSETNRRAYEDALTYLRQRSDLSPSDTLTHLTSYLEAHHSLPHQDAVHTATKALVVARYRRRLAQIQKEKKR